MALDASSFESSMLEDLSTLSESDWSESDLQPRGLMGMTSLNGTSTELSNAESARTTNNKPQEEGEPAMLSLGNHTWVPEPGNASMNTSVLASIFTAPPSEPSQTVVGSSNNPLQSSSVTNNIINPALTGGYNTLSNPTTSAPTTITTRNNNNNTDNALSVVFPSMTSGALNAPATDATGLSLGAQTTMNDMSTSSNTTIATNGERHRTDSPPPVHGLMAENKRGRRGSDGSNSPPARKRARASSEGVSSAPQEHLPLASGYMPGTEDTVGPSTTTNTRRRSSGSHSHAARQGPGAGGRKSSAAMSAAVSAWMKATIEYIPSGPGDDKDDQLKMARSELYQLHVNACVAADLTPVHVAQFGKLVKEAFPGISTRRLGARKQSTYFVLGIRVKEDVDLDTQASIIRNTFQEKKQGAAAAFDDHSAHPQHQHQHQHQHQTHSSSNQPQPARSCGAFTGNPSCRLPQKTISNQPARPVAVTGLTAPAPTRTQGTVSAVRQAASTALANLFSSLPPANFIPSNADSDSHGSPNSAAAGSTSEVSEQSEKSLVELLNAPVATTESFSDRIKAPPENSIKRQFQLFMGAYRSMWEQLINTVAIADYTSALPVFEAFWFDVAVQQTPALLADEGLAEYILAIEPVCYKILLRVALPSVTQEKSASAITAESEALREFVSQLAILCGTECLQTVEMTQTLALGLMNANRLFRSCLTRRIDLRRVCQAVRALACTKEERAGLLSEWSRVAFSSLLEDMTVGIEPWGAFCSPGPARDATTARRPRKPPGAAFADGLLTKFSAYLNGQFTMSHFLMLVDEMIGDWFDQHPRTTVHGFVSCWNMVGSGLMRELSCVGATRIGTFQLIKTMMDEHMLDLIHTRISP